MMISSQHVKEILHELGAELCGISGVDRFADAPRGFHPLDVLPTCRSVVSFACRLPAGTLASPSPIPYTRVRNSLSPKLDAIALDFCIRMEQEGALAMPIPTNESVWDEKTSRWRSILSQKHAAQAAGLGAIGRHSLLITPELGSLVWLGCVLTEAELEPDPLKPNPCTNCDLCVRACPVHALNEPQLNQSVCWDYAFGDDPKLKTWCISCHKCRDVCPHNFGSRNAAFKRD